MIFFLKSYKYYRILTYVVHFMVIILIIKLIQQLIFFVSQI